MYESKVGVVVAGTLGALAGLTLLLGAFVNPIALGVAAPFAAAAALVWYHASGRLRAHVQAGRVGGGRRVRDERRARRSAAAGARARAGPGGRRGRRRGAGGRARRRPPASGPSRREAYRVLGLDPGASEGDVRRAYRERAKSAHPDRGGDEGEFKRLTAAYERLTG